MADADKEINIVLPKSVIAPAQKSLTEAREIIDNPFPAKFPNHAIITLTPDAAAELLETISKGVCDAAAITSNFTEVIRRNPKPEDPTPDEG